MNYCDFLTTHGRQRMQQRGISLEMVELVLKFGETFYHKGAEVTSLSKQGKQRLEESSLGRQLIEKLRKIYVVERNGKVLTVAMKSKTHKRD